MSWTGLRDDHVVKQRMDYSCGAAALATLMRHYFEDDVTEKDILTDIFNHLSPAELLDRQTEGLSLLDLQQAAERRGYQSAGVQLPLSALPDLGIVRYLQTVWPARVW